ncbi:MAG: hypothetical protein QXD46_01550 [Thermofilum sp.]
MSDPIVAHVIGTITLLGALLIITAALTYIHFSNYIDSVNLMLAEVAEAAAREIVEVVSVYTLGGAGASYMKATLPDTLAGQPYLIRISGGGDNVLEITAMLQIYQQVRVVVMPNFGRYPVRAVPTRIPKESFAGQVPADVSETLLMPLPEGYEPVIVVYRSADEGCAVPSSDPVTWRAICVGLAAAPKR